MLSVWKCGNKENAQDLIPVTSGQDLASRWQETNQHRGAGRRFHRNRPRVKKVTVRVFFFISEKRQGGLLKERGETDAIEQQKVFYYPFYKPPSKNIPTMMKMLDLNSTITRLWMVRAPSLFHDDFFILLWSLELKRQSGRQPCAPLQLCVSLQIRRLPAPSITRTSFPSLPSPLKPF